MPTGIQIWDGSNLIVDTTTGLGVFVGTFSTGGAKSGTTTIPSLIGKTPIYTTVKSGFGLSNSGGIYISFNPSTGVFNWDTNDVSNGTITQDTYTVFYGFT